MYLFIFFSNIRFMPQTYWKRLVASARESIWVHFKNDMRPDRLRDESSYEGNKQNTIKCHNTDRSETEGNIEEMKKKDRKEPFAVNSFLVVNCNQMAQKSGATAKVLRDASL